MRRVLSKSKDAISIVHLRLVAIVGICHILAVSRGCGTGTHVNIAHEASTFFRSPTNLKVDYTALIQKHQDAFIAGNPYPDAMYPSLCFGGSYHEVAEDTHWGEFLNATITYVNVNFPQPWDMDTEKLVAFIFGFVSHQIADVTWHSLGIEQGFLRSMAAANFHGVFDDAHSDGDVGGDMLTMWNQDDKLIPISTWYVPIEDLYQIYKSFYGSNQTVPKYVIELCSKLVYIEYIAEKIAGREIFKLFAKKSPFLVQQLHNFFLGGIHDMASWTQLIWNDTAYMLEHGTANCNMQHNTLFVNCGIRNSSIPFTPTLRSVRNPGRRDLPLLHLGVNASDVKTVYTKRGVYFHPDLVVDRLSKLCRERIYKNDYVTYGQPPPRAIIVTKSPYSELGWKISNVRYNGVDALAISAPNHGLPGRPQVGRVYIATVQDLLLSGNESEHPEKDIVLTAKQVIEGRNSMSKFGWSIAATAWFEDVKNCSGCRTDVLLVGAPSSGADELLYHGEVFAYNFSDLALQPARNSRISYEPSYTNFGYALRSHDGDCVSFGAPLSSRQSGFRLLSGKDCPTGNSTGVYDYSWYGFDTEVVRIDDDHTLVFTSSPLFRRCYLPDCTFHPGDQQAVGAVEARLFYRNEEKAVFNISGDKEFGQFGWSLSVGDPFGTKDFILAISSPSKDVIGSVAGAPFQFTQAGEVVLFNISRLLDFQAAGRGDFSDCIVAEFQGDRSYGYFGSTVRFVDIYDSGRQQLIITAPRRSWDITEELWGGEEGALYVFGSRSDFPLGFVTTDCPSIFDTLPCPEDVAARTFSGKEVGARFGESFEVVRSHDPPLLAVSAPRSSLGSFHGGALYLYDL